MKTMPVWKCTYKARNLPGAKETGLYFLFLIGWYQAREAGAPQPC